MTVLAYARLHGVTTTAVYSKIKRGLLPDRRDKQGCREIPDGTPWPKGRPGVKAQKGRVGDAGRSI